MKVGIVIGSGSLKCAAAIGLWRVLRRHGIEVSVAVGCSGGSMYAYCLARGYDVEEAARISTELWQKWKYKLSYRSMLGAVLPRFFNEHFGLVDDRGVNVALRDLCEEQTFEAMKIPLHLVATDLATGEKVVMSTGPIFDAMRASIAIPLVLRPWRVGGRLLFDGGASDPLPVDVAMREGCDVIIAMGFDNPLVEPGSALALALQTSSIAINHLLSASYAFNSLAHHAEIIPVIPSFDRPIGLRDAHLMDYIIEQGAIAAEREVPYILKLRDLVGPPPPAAVEAS